MPNSFILHPAPHAEFDRPRACPKSLCRGSQYTPVAHDLSREEINALPIHAYHGDVVLVQNERELEVALNDLWDETVLGFDTETRPTFTKGPQPAPALVQLGGANKVYLVQLMHVAFGEALAALLSARHIIKVGVAIHDDMKALQRQYDFVPGGVEDLAAMARVKNIKAQGLRSLAAQMLGFRISKGAQCSNWEKPDLTDQQIRYAATDAWVGREIYIALLRHSGVGASALE